MSSAFIQATVILLREGLEAMLVIAALAGYLKKTGGGHRVSALYAGGGGGRWLRASLRRGCSRC